jgi:hypothetical protein
MAKADLGITVRVTGADKAEAQLEGVGRAAKKAGEGASSAGQEFKSFGSLAGDASEALDKKLDQSIGRSFKGFDRITGIVGQATGAMALLTGALGLAKFGYDKLISGPRELAKSQTRLAVSTRQTIEALQDEASELGTLQERVQFTGAAHRDALPALDGFEKSLRRQVETLREQKVASDAARVAADAFLRSIVDDKFAVALEQRTAVLEARRQEVVAIAGLEAAEANFARVQTNSTKVRLANAQRELAFRRDVLAEETFQARQQAGKVAAPAVAAAPKRAESAGDGFDDQAGGDLQFLIAQEAVARQEIERVQADAATRATDREAINRSTRLALMESDTEREIEILAGRHRQEFAAAEKADADLIGLKRKHAKELAAITKKTDKLDKESNNDKVKRHAQSAQVLAGAMKEGAEAFGLGVGVEMVAAGIADAGRSATYAAQSIGRFASQDYFGGAAFAAASIAAGAAAVKNFAGAATLGAGGGGGGGGGTVTPIAPSGPAERSNVGDGGGEQTTVINVQFGGRTFATARELREDVASIVGNRGRGGRVIGG